MNRRWQNDGKSLLRLSCCLVEMCPPSKWYVDVFTLGTAERGCLWRQSLCTCGLLKLRSLELAVVQCDWCPYKKGKRGHRDKHRRQRQGEGRDTVIHERGEQRPTLPTYHQTLGERQGTDSCTALRRNQSCRHLDLGLPAARTVRHSISVV